MRQPLIIALLAVPIIIQVYLNAGIAYAINRALGVPHNVACPSALIGASNFFELAVAAAIALFGFHANCLLTKWPLWAEPQRLRGANDRYWRILPVPARSGGGRLTLMSEVKGRAA